MAKIKIGIIGCGGIVRVLHAPAFQNIENAEIVATCDVIKERAQNIAKQLDAKYVFTDYKELLAMPDIDMVDICTPNYLHSVIAIDALKSGKHVFCEKPDAISVENVTAMKAAAEQSGNHLMVMRNNRFAESSKYAKQYIEDGKCGDIYAGRCGWIRRRGIPGKGGWFTTKAQSGGGPLIDLGVHMIDLAVWLMGNPAPVAVSGAIFNKFADDSAVADSVHAQFGDSQMGGSFDVEDLAMGMIRFDNGAILQIEFSWASNIEKEDIFVELRGSKAGLNWRHGALTIYTEDGDYKPIFNDRKSGHEKNLAHFINDVLIGGKAPTFVPMQGVNMVKILTSIYESAKQGREISLV
ncbi:MAG: Gfo/Idh/MocA family oxidoreductase [Oscillospiraceae bacterium]|nr:Gfo/Idh/MocA family oxidoreductase [Oscillospiraceae bacterium]